MDRRGSNTWLIAVLAIAVGFLAALLIFGGDDNSANTSATVANGTTAATGTATTTTTTGPNGATTTSTTSVPQPAATTPQRSEATTASCIELWNQPLNRGAQVFLVNLASQQPVRVNVGTTTAVPPECLVTIVANNGDAYTYPEGGGTSYPYAVTPGKTISKELPVDQKTANALEQRDGTLKAR